MKAFVAILALLTLAPTLAMAAPWTADDIVIFGTAGTGSNASYLVLDFGSASYAFKYLWNTPAEGELYGFDLLSALTAEGTGIAGLGFTYHTSGGMGAMIDSITYGAVSGAGNWPDPWWNYWTGPAGGPIGSSWVGVSASPLSNGSVDAWVLTDNWEHPPFIPGVPEPSSLACFASLIGLAGSARLLRGRCR